MEFKSPTVSQIKELKAQIRQLEKKLELEKKALERAKVAEGWKMFRFVSEYYGSHPERGGDDELAVYLFRPELDISRWDGVRFSHGSHGGENESNELFQDWIDSLLDEQYLVIPGNR